MASREFSGLCNGSGESDVVPAAAGSEINKEHSVQFRAGLRDTRSARSHAPEIRQLLPPQLSQTYGCLLQVNALKHSSRPRQPHIFHPSSPLHSSSYRGLANTRSLAPISTTSTTSSRPSYYPILSPRIFQIPFPSGFQYQLSILNSRCPLSVPLVLGFHSSPTPE